MGTKSKTSNEPVILFYGDGKGHYQRALTPILNDLKLNIERAKSAEDFEKKATNAVLIIVGGDDIDSMIDEIPAMKARNARIVADILLFIGDHRTSEDRMRFLAGGYDGVFNDEFIVFESFASLLKGRINKGFISLENRIQQEEYKRFKAALSASPDAFIVLDHDYKVFFVSEHYKKAYPKNGQKLRRGMPILEAFEMLSPEHNVLPDSKEYRAMRNFWMKPQGSIEFVDYGRTWRISAAPLPEMQGTIITTTDITDFLKQQKDLSEALEKEREASAIQKQFVDMISHEFRTPLSIIDGHAQILLKRGEDIEIDQQKNRLKIMRSAVSRLVNMMEGILSSNMIKTGKLNLAKQPDNLIEVLNELLDVHQNLSKDVTIKMGEIENIPDKLHFDRKILNMILDNLLSNAVKFSKNDAYVILNARYDKETPDKLSIEVQDSGIGIPDNEIGRVFDKYYRTTISSGIPGTGIGLSLVSDLVQLHGGQINVKSTMGEGTCFYFEVDVSIPNDD